MLTSPWEAATVAEAAGSKERGRYGPYHTELKVFFIFLLEGYIKTQSQTFSWHRLKKSIEEGITKYIYCAVHVIKILAGGVRKI